jgi:hypothetical protein
MWLLISKRKAISCRILGPHSGVSKSSVSWERTPCTPASTGLSEEHVELKSKPSDKPARDSHKTITSCSDTPFDLYRIIYNILYNDEVIF